MYKPHQGADGARDPQTEGASKTPGGAIVGQHKTTARLGNSETRSLSGLEISFELSRA